MFFEIVCNGIGKTSFVNYKEGQAKLISFMRVSQLKEVAPGIWWPIKIYTVSSPLENGQPWRRHVYHAFDVVVNDSNFDESIFTIPFPEGYVVDDKVTGRKYKVGEK